MQFGWSTDEKTSFAVMDAFVEGSGNLIDTADSYSNWSAANPGGVFEEIIGRWVNTRGNRDEVFIATKVRGPMGEGAEGYGHPRGREGLSRRWILQACKDSLRRLQVDHIDLYQAHWIGPKVPIEETLSALTDLVHLYPLLGLARLKDLLERLKTELKPSLEYGSQIIHSLETNTPRVIYGNVVNDGLITNLPEGCCAEVPCLVDAGGVQPTAVGKLPPQCAAVNCTNINVQELAVEAALTGNLEHIYHAVQLDPLTASLLTLGQIRNLVDELLEAEAAWLPEFAKPQTEVA